MDNIISRYWNLSILAGVLLLQLLGLAVQVKRPDDVQRPEAGSTRLIRVWAVSAVTPVEKVIAGAGRFVKESWRNYVYLRGVREENERLRNDIERLRIEQVRLSEDAAQARRLQSLLAFKEQYVGHTVAAQVIGSSGTEQSRLLYIDKGSSDGLRHDMAVITPDGIVGKVKEVFSSSAQVLLINDQLSGAGAVLEKSRLQGTVKGTPAGELVLDHVMADNPVEVGERVLASGGDRIFPKGFPIGTVTQVSPGRDIFLNIRIRPAANLGRLEEVLIITQVQERAPQLAEGEKPVRAADVLADRLPTFTPKPPDAAPGTTPSTGATPRSAAVKPGAGAANPNPDVAAGASTPAPPPAGNVGSQRTGALQPPPKPKKTPASDQPEAPQ